MLDTARADVDVTKRGVRLGYLVRLMSEALPDAAATIADVVEKVVRPATFKYRYVCATVNTLLEHQHVQAWVRVCVCRCCMFNIIPAEHTGPPQYFISHT